ncbi:MAG: hypothetical protein JWM20_903 [Patescibacteria group bacterium]|nr:hypothetical protein [Patescibacteria group bacterium]
MKMPGDSNFGQPKNNMEDFSMKEFRRLFWKRLHQDRLPEELRKRVAYIYQATDLVTDEYEKRPSMQAQLTPLLLAIQAVLVENNSDQAVMLDKIEKILANPPKQEATREEPRRERKEEPRREPNREGAPNATVYVLIKDGQVHYFDSNKKPISEKMAQDAGVPQPVRTGGSIVFGATSFDMNGTSAITFEKGKIKTTQTSSGDVSYGKSTTYSSTFTSSSQGNYSEAMGSKTIDASTSPSLDKIMGGNTVLNGTGTVTINKIMGGMVTVKSGVTLILDKLMGGIITIEPGGKVVANTLMGGIVKGRDRITFRQNMGAMIN